ncbi:MAG: hypothetical protein ABJA71_05925 [Ginsengibacter sp.]
MNHTLLLIAMILIWIAVIVGLYQRIFEMPKWFVNPPASFELIRRQSKKYRTFWLPLSTLFIISLIAALILNWQYTGIRNHIFGALACFGLTGALNDIYFVKELIAFTKIPVVAPQTPELLQRTKLWLKWTSVREVLQIFAAMFVTISYTHS